MADQADNLDTEVSPAEPTYGSGTEDIKSVKFISLLLTQFLGAMNDNLFRWLAVPVAKARGPQQFKNFNFDETFALSAGLACFVLPYVVFSPWASYLADRLSKRRVIVACKLAEIIIMLFGVFSIWHGNVILLFIVVFLMGTQSALFGPSKLGIIPEIVKPKHISNANGLIGVTTVLAVVAGTIAAGSLFEIMKVGDSLPDQLNFAQLWPAMMVVVLAIVGFATSLFIPVIQAANPKRAFPINPIMDSVRDLKVLAEDRAILRVALGITFFWGMAALAQLNVDTYVENELHGNQSGVSLMLGVLSLGVGVGSILAGVFSGGKVELGLVPPGALCLAVSSMLLFFTDNTAVGTAVMLFMLGFGGGFYDVPLAAYLQHEGPREKMGSILAGSNFLTFSAMLVVSLLFSWMQGTLGMAPRTVFLITGLATIPVAIYVFLIVPQATIRFLVWLATHTVYRVKMKDAHNVPAHGGALIVANHVSWVDGVLLLVSSSRPIRMIAYADYIRKGPVGWTAKLFGVIPIEAGGKPKAIMRALRTARQAVERGELVCIFAEGVITRTGQLQPFQRGMMKIVEGTDAPVIPAYLDELWGSIFSYSGGRFFWKLPRRIPFPVTISFGKPIHGAKHVHPVRQSVQMLGVKAMEERKHRQMIPVRKFIRQCKSSRFRKKVADSAGTELTGGKFLTGALMMHRLLDRHIFSPEEKMVGLLLPPSVGGAVVNAAVTLSGRVAVNLNYTLSDDVMNYCANECGVTHVLTSKRFIEKRPVELDAELVFLEDLKEQATTGDKVASLFEAFVMPTSLLESKLGLKKISPDDLLTVIFTSGSTGEPKGVMLSHNNVGTNIEGVDQLFHLKRSDTILGVLPFFHSFGYTVTLWLPAITNPAVVYHFNPLDGRTVGKLCGKHKVTILGATPTFLRTYLKRCTPEQMEHLDLTIVGAEKLPPDLANQFKEKFGVEPTEGYGTTELSPVAAFNVPPHRTGTTMQSGTKMGTVGRPMPGATARVLHPDTQQELGPNEEGLLMIKGPNVMMGYLNQKEKSDEVLCDGWYNTGDFARIDDDGFIEITGRQSRFSKIGGEMVPHIRIEQELARIADDPDDEEPNVLVAVTSVPHPSKGERLIVVHKKLIKPIEQILDELSETGLPNIWMPSRDSFVEVEAIPLLGTGKLDLKGLKDMALEKFGNK